MKRVKVLSNGYVMHSKFLDDAGYDPPGTPHLTDDEYREKLRERFPNASDRAIERQIMARKKQD